MKSWRRLAGELIRYGLVGSAINFSGYLIFLLLTHFGMDHKIAMSLLYVSGVVAGFVANRRWTFEAANGVFASGFRYLCAHAVGYAFNLILLVILVDIWGYPHQFAQALAVFLVAGFLFIVFKLFVFPVTSQDQR
ncbi:hypothetical protein A9P79_23405 [Cupriavidus taiwanensis]|nr:hypothetical protein A9P79_23405 [Cupriavidus taiwanensis]